MNLYDEQIKNIIYETLGDNKVTIVLYGSRARGNARSNSDYDIALKSAEPISPAILSQIKFRLEESNIPFKIDIVDFLKISDELRRSILKEGVIW